MGQFQAQDYAKLLPVVGAGVALAYFIVKNVRSGGCGAKEGTVNPDIEKEKDKVVHMMDIEDIGEKAAFCRCWRSKKFPYCDGSHAKFNEATGDNVGPVIVKRKS